MIIVAKKHPHVLGDYIGRPSALGNPFVIGKHGTREEVIERYRQWLRVQLAVRGSPARRQFDTLLQKYRDQGSLTLVCWCHPLPCHGDVVREFLLEFNSTHA